MSNSVVEKLQELISEINSSELQEKVMGCFETAVSRSKLSWEDLAKMPFTLLIPNCSTSFLEHTERVLRLSIAIAREMKNFSLNTDFLAAGAILHDIGKLLTVEKVEENGKTTYKRKEITIFVPYNVLGAHIALLHDIPPQVAHIVLAHASEYEGKRMTEEALIVSEVDRLLFELAKTHARSVIWHHG